MSANLYDVLALLLLLLGAYLFWQWRLQEEHARKHAEAVCKQYNVQFLDIARSRGRPRFTPRTGWEAGFQFGFSSDIQTRYEGELVLLNLHLSSVNMPPHKAPEAKAEGAIEGETIGKNSASSAHTSSASTHSASAGWNPSETNKTATPQPQMSPRNGPHQIPVPNSQLAVTSMSISYGDRKTKSDNEGTNNNTLSGAATDELPPIVDAIFPDEPLAEGESNYATNAADLKEGPAITIDGINTSDG